MANKAPATKADIENVALLIQQMTERLDRRFDAVDRRFELRFEAIENRLDRMNDGLVYVQSQMASLTRWSDRMARNHSAMGKQN